jgi:Zn-dependent peptidase ImmA (M78 family)
MKLEDIIRNNPLTPEKVTGLVREECLDSVWIAPPLFYGKTTKGGLVENGANWAVYINKNYEEEKYLTFMHEIVHLYYEYYDKDDEVTFDDAGRIEVLADAEAERFVELHPSFVKELCESLVKPTPINLLKIYFLVQ